jgi:hypothetical protein
MLNVVAPPVIPRSQISVGLDPSLRASLGMFAAGRMLVLDYFASRRCSVVIGDLTCGLRAALPIGDFVELTPIEGVRLFVERRLLAILGEAGPSLRMAGPPFARHLAVKLEQPERWIDFLDGPGVLAGKGRFRLRSRPDGPSGAPRRSCSRSSPPAKDSGRGSRPVAAKLERDNAGRRMDSAGAVAMVARSGGQPRRMRAG